MPITIRSHDRQNGDEPQEQQGRREGHGDNAWPFERDAKEEVAGDGEGGAEDAGQREVDLPAGFRERAERSDHGKAQRMESE